MSVLPRTAVVVVHGIGEQRPLDTIRQFVGRGDGKGGLLEQQDAGHVFVNPDHISGRTYARRLSFDHTHRVRENGVPPVVAKNIEDLRTTYARTTHFYEYYWAYRFRDTAWRHLPPILSRIVRSKRHELAARTMSGGAGLLSKAARLVIVILAAAFAVCVAVAVSYAASEADPPGWFALLPQLVSDRSLISVSATLAVVLLIVTLSLALTMGVLTTVRTMLGLPVVAIAGAIAGYLVAASTSRDYAVLSAAAVGLLTLPFLIYPFRLSVWFSVGSALLGIVAMAVIFESNQSAVLDLKDLARVALGLSAAVLPALAGGFALRSVGDASRYLSESPENVGEREEVRRGLMNLLEGLHEKSEPVTGRPLYERIVVVGHSLGSVIAYDAVTQLWASRNQSFVLPDHDADDERFPLAKLMHDLEEAAKPLREATCTADQRTTWWSLQQSLATAMRTQLAWKDDGLWKQPGRWIISDLVTVGSPLTYAEVLLADGINDLKAKCTDRLLLTCPPVEQRTAPAKDKYPLRYRAWRGKSYVTKLHHATCFAPTQWTNLYFKHDLVGGPLAARFGNGVRDISFSGYGSNLFWFLRRYPHSSYWGGTGDGQQAGVKEAVDTLRSIVIREHPILLAIGEPDAVKTFRSLLMDPRLLPRIQPPYTPSDTTIDSAFFELRLLRKSPDHQPPRAWTWLGFEPWYPLGQLGEILELATQAGISVKFAGSRPKEVQEPPDEDRAISGGSTEKTTPERTNYEKKEATAEMVGPNDDEPSEEDLA